MATSLALFLVMIPYWFILFLKIYLVPIIGWCFGLGTKVQTLFLANWFNSSCIASTQNSSHKASSIFLGSIWEMKAKLIIDLSLDLVVTPCVVSPMMSSCGWAFLNYQSFGRSSFKVGWGISSFSSLLGPSSSKDLLAFFSYVFTSKRSPTSSSTLQISFLGSSELDSSKTTCMDSSTTRVLLLKLYMLC